ncbi:MAG: hypothetical protein M3Z23_12845 [Acidobacteriota bacterium]|nr:hypothetical protein [Acidobacteriota bacterium]
MKDKEYWRIFHLIRGDVEAAIKSNHTYFTINNLVLTDRDVSNKLNRFPEFWQFNAYSLQTTFFIAFGRLFDTRSDAHSVLKLVDATIANPHLFSKAALRMRRREQSDIHDPDPEWLEPSLSHEGEAASVNAAWEPTTIDLATLKSALEPHRLKFKSIYRPIRHSFFAHRSMESDAEIFARFQKTNIKEAEEILRFLHTLLWAIWEMAWNGRRLDITDSSDYEGWVKDMNAKTEKLIRQLP